MITYDLFNYTKDPEDMYKGLKKLLHDFDIITSGTACENEAVEYCIVAYKAAIIRDGMAMWSTTDNMEHMPSDAFYDFVKYPTFMITGILMYTWRNFPRIRSFPGVVELLCAAMRGIVRLGFRGHGYDAIESLLTSMDLFIRCGAYEFVEEYPGLCPEFKEELERTTLHIQETAADGNLRNEWNTDYSKQALELFRNIHVLDSDVYLFVYGNPKQNQQNNNIFEGAVYCGTGVLRDYALYNLGSFPGIAPKRNWSVLGEVYRLKEAKLIRIDDLTGNGKLYKREFVNIANTNGDRTKAFAYIYAEELYSEPQRLPWGKRPEDYLWYVSYGSNLLGERFMCYIQGGKFRGNVNGSSGCTDKTLPLASVRVTVPGQIFFAKKSHTWDGSGVAFLDAQTPFYTLGRAWLVTREQFEQIHEKEGEIWYSKKVELGSIDGIKAVTFTSDVHFQETEPNENYKTVLCEGFRETQRLEYREILTGQ